jgi:hypothetical protein
MASFLAISPSKPPLRVKYLEYYESSNFRTLTNQGEIGMSQQQKLEKVLDLLLSEDSDQAAELLHQIIVEKARVIYENIVEEEDVADEDKEEVTESEDEVGGEPNKDFTDEIASDKEEVDADEQNDGEAGGEEAGEGSDEEGEEAAGEEMGEGDVEDRVEDLESQLAELRAEFDALMGEEMQEPEHADLAGEFGDDVEPADDMDGEMPDMGGMGGEEKVVGEVVATMFEKKKNKKLEVAPQKKDAKKDKKVDEETQFLSKVGDTGQKGTAKLVGTGKNTPLGAEQTKSSFTNIPPRKDYGGKPTNILGSKATGGEYGKYNGDSATDDTPSDNVKVEPKKSGVKADTTAKYTGGKSAGPGFTKSPLTKKPA